MAILRQLNCEANGKIKPKQMASDNGAWGAAKATALFILHQLLSTAGLLFLAQVLTFTAVGAARARPILLTIPYFPVQITLAVVTGALLRICFKHRAMEWVWILPLALLSIGFLETPLPFLARVGLFFGTDCKLYNHCFVQTGLTAPFYTAAAYSISAFLTSKLSVSLPRRVGQTG
jgi:hypothetical protein